MLGARVEGSRALARARALSRARASALSARARRRREGYAGRGAGGAGAMSRCREGARAGGARGVARAASLWARALSCALLGSARGRAIFCKSAENAGDTSTHPATTMFVYDCGFTPNWFDILSTRSEQRDYCAPEWSPARKKGVSLFVPSGTRESGIVWGVSRDEP